MNAVINTIPIETITATVLLSVLIIQNEDRSGSTSAGDGGGGGCGSRNSDATETRTVRKNLKTGEGIVSSTGGKWSNCSARECLSRDETADA